MPRLLSRLASAAPLAALLILGAARGGRAQAGAAAPAAPAAPSGAAAAAARPADERTADLVARVRRDPQSIALPPADQFTEGDRVIAAGDTVRGTAAVAHGNLEIRGVVLGDAVALRGDVMVLPGARVGGSAFAAHGRVRVDGGRVEGEVRALDGVLGPLVQPARTRSAPSAAQATQQALKLTFGWLTVLLLVGIGTLVFAGSYLDGVVEALERNFARSILVGLGAQIALIPLLLVGLVALAVTVLGVLLIPFAIVAYLVAAAGLVTIGFLAAAQLAGRLVARAPAGRSAADRGVALRALVAGIVLFVGLWAVAAALTWAPLAGSVLRAIAAAVTWAACTVGLGAAVLSRAGTLRPRQSVARGGSGPAAPVHDLASWQTPTPIGGIAAARRPTGAATRLP